MASKKKPKPPAKAKAKAGSNSPKALVARLEKLRENEDWGRFVEVLREAIRQAPDAKGVLALEDAEGVEEMFLGEDDAGPVIAGALVDKAFELGGTEGAKVIGIAIRAAIHDTFEVARRAIESEPSGSTTIKSEFLGALDTTIERFREGTQTSSGPFRAACVYALGVLRTSGAEDLDAISNGLLTERVAEARAAGLLTSAVLMRRTGLSTALAARSLERVQELEKKLGAKLTGLECAATVLVHAVMKQDLSDALVDAMKAVLQKPAALPPSFGFHAGATTNSLFEIALSSLPPASVTAVLGMLTKSAVFAELLVALGFGNKPKSELEFGLLESELQPHERTVLQAFASQAFAHEHQLRRKLGFFSGAGVGQFLAGTGALWKPLLVETKEGQRTLHALQIWRRTARDQITVDAAISAITGALSAEELSELACTSDEAVLTSQTLRDNDDRKRERALTIALFSWLEANDAEWPKRAAEWPQKYGRSPHTGLALLRLVDAGRLSLHENFYSPIQYSMLHILTYPSDGIVELLLKLPVEWKSRMVDGGRDSSDSIRRLLNAP